MSNGDRTFYGTIVCGLVIALLYFTNPWPPPDPNAKAEYPQVYDNFVLAFMDAGTKQRLEDLGQWGKVRFHTYKKPCVAGSYGDAKNGQKSVDIYICPGLTNKDLRIALCRTLHAAHANCCGSGAITQQMAEQSMLKELFPQPTVTAPTP